MTASEDMSTIDRAWSVSVWSMAIGLLVVSSILGFAVLSRYQLNDPTLDLWSAICRGLGIPIQQSGAREQPRPIVSSHVVWNNETFAKLRAGDIKRGEFVARNCVVCHKSTQANAAQLIPLLDGMNVASIYKQLQDYRDGNRSWGVMGAIAKALTERDAIDVAAYFAQRSGPAPTTYPFAAVGERGFNQPDEARHLVFVGDPKRGIAPCSACHGPSAFKLGAPSLEGQNPEYLQRQLVSFAQALRKNDVFGTMRTISRQLAADEKKSLAQFYGSRPRLLTQTQAIEPPERASQ
ncbi:c-type cytochrome [Rhizobium mesoamericanum]|uniref:c-type cytochrome n=1 Tax=Rhizobium mesoamericanum TaxID=1079800 RepID=UPI000416EC09|nr:hypothetical protein [Rhizobium mesoamericanum]